MTPSLALGCAVSFDHDLSANPKPLASLLFALTAELPADTLRQCVTSEHTQRGGRPATFHAQTLVDKVRSRNYVAAIVEARSKLDDEHLRVQVEVTPAARLRDRVARRHGSYDLVAAFGPYVLSRIGVQRTIAALVEFADGVGAQAGAMAWTKPATFPPGLAKGAGGNGLAAAHDGADRRDGRRVARGPAWGTFLGTHHVERLGGIDAVRTGSGAEYVLALRSGGAYLQLTSLDEPVIERASARRLEALAAFLGPVLDAE